MRAHDLGGDEAPAIGRRQSPRRFRVVEARALALEPQQLLTAGVSRPAARSSSVTPKSREIFGRKIDAAARRSAATSRMMLVSCSAIPRSDGVGARRGIAVAEDLDADQSDRRRDAPAVLGQRANVW